MWTNHILNIYIITKELAYSIQYEGKMKMKTVLKGEFAKIAIT